ncbi:uncharacterized protein LOC132047508 [Lycium ferocissimum]|uniref:uncharacterized protein LOC132047508 n=1 Tax=Lycium ferocissimum TaxID=112874 RepID=UPI0028157C98|nr:uncharacterized protein LOC132047508 [Lycium ferocissimum]
MRSYIDETTKLCIISYRHPSIKKAGSIVFPTSHYGCCMMHLGENLRTTFHNSKAVSHFYKAAKAYNIDVFNNHFNQIRDMVPGATEHLRSAGFHRWSREFCFRNKYLHITVSNTYNLMTTNIAESVNAMFNVEREFSIIALFDSINRRFTEKFHERLARVDLQRRSSTCRVFDLDKIPYLHAMATLRVQYGEDFGRRIYDYSSPYYKMENYIIAYCEEICPMPSKESWEVPMEILEREIPPPHVDPRKSGRRRTKRRRGIGDHFQPGKINAPYTKELATKELHAQIEMHHSC